MLEKNGNAVPGTRVTYAQGRLVLRGPDPRLIDANGENIGQTCQFVRTCNAPLGFLAAARVFTGKGSDDYSENNKVASSYWEPPQSRYTPIIQQAVFIKDTPTTRAFIEFVKSDAVRALIYRHDYLTPKLDSLGRAD